MAYLLTYKFTCWNNISLCIMLIVAYFTITLAIYCDISNDAKLCYTIIHFIMYNKDIFGILHYDFFSIISWHTIQWHDGDLWLKSKHFKVLRLYFYIIKMFYNYLYLHWLLGWSIQDYCLTDWCFYNSKQMTEAENCVCVTVMKQDIKKENQKQKTNI